MAEEQQTTAQDITDETITIASTDDTTDGATDTVINNNTAETATDPETAEPTLESLSAALATAQAEAQANQDKYLRSEAELVNVRKRAEREAEKARKFALERFAGDLLAVLDSLQMGIEAAQQDTASVDSIREGAEMTTKLFLSTLQKFAVVELDPTGEKFNPEQHEAMVMQPSAEVEPNTIITTIQKGYMLNDRLLRPARVIVAQAAAE